MTAAAALSTRDADLGAVPLHENGGSVTVLEAPTLPGLPRLGDPAAQGRLAALRTLHEAMTSPNGRETFRTTVVKIAAGRAPQEFKDAFAITLNDLCAALSD